MDLTTITPTLQALRALSHPVRLRMLGLLRSEGPATATTLAARLGLNTGATSYHLRQLAQHGFIVDDEGRGNARDRWWKAAHRSTRTAPADDPDAQAAQDAFLRAVAVVHAEQLQRAVEEAELLPARWRRASTASDWALRLTPRRAQALVEALEALVEGAEEDDDPDAGEFVVMLHAFPRPGTVAGDPR
ncbi:helix-turn-helix domain-containing protein [Sorangium sp. So ce118]